MLPRDLTLAILLGAVLALPYVSYARRSRRPPAVFAIGLIVAAAVYVGLALFAANTRALVVETGGLLLFAALAAAGVRWSSHLLAAAWLGHVAWDLLLHPVQSSGYAPWWYPALCIGFDIFVAGFIAAQRIRES